MEDDTTNFNFTKPAIIIPTVSGSISFISSMLIIYVIFKSPKLVFSTPYHLRAEAAAKLLGVDLSALAIQPGNAWVRR